MEVEITHTIRDITSQEWESVAGTTYIERSYAWFKTVEDSGMRDMRYILLREHNTLTAAACCFPYTEKKYVTIPFLEVRSPLGTSTAFFCKTPQQARTLVAGLKEIQKKEKLKGILIFELKKEEFLPLKRTMKGFIHFPIREDTYIDLHFKDFDSYVRSLKKNAGRKSVRNTLNKAKRWGIKLLVTTEFSKWKSIARKLQGYTCRHHNDDRTYLTEKYYDACEKNLKDKAELLIWFKDDIPLTSVLCFNSPTISLCKYVGIDPEYRKYQAYFLLYYEALRRAIERGQKRVYFGPSTYAYKEKIGCKREELFGFAQMENPVVDVVLKSYVALSKKFGKKF